MDSRRTLRRLLPCSVATLALLAGCLVSSSDEEMPDDETSGPATTDPETMPPEACPDVTDPECTTDAPCGNDEECILCECRPTGTSCAEIPGAECSESAECGPGDLCEDCQCLTPGCPADSECLANDDCSQGEYCSNLGATGCACIDLACAEPGACTFDEDCAQGEVCTDCECVADCLCDGDEDCMAPQTCDGCACVDPVAGCATGDAIAPGSPDITVSGTNIAAEISGDPGDCPMLLCSFSVTNDTDGYITFGLLESLPDDPIAPMPIVSAVAGGETAEFEVWANDCSTPTMLDRTLFIHDEANGVSLGEIGLLWQTSLP